MGRLLDINEALEVSGLSERRLRDILAAVEAGHEAALPGAHKNEARRWRIPEERARSLRERLPLTEEERRNILEQSRSKGWPTKRIIREINAARWQAGDPPISHSAVYKFLQKHRDAAGSLREGASSEEPVPKVSVYTDPAELPVGIDKETLMELVGNVIRPVEVSIDGNRARIDDLDLELDISSLSPQARRQLEGVGGVVLYGEDFYGPKRDALFTPNVLSIIEVIRKIPDRIQELYGTTDLSEVMRLFMAQLQTGEGPVHGKG